MAVNKVTLGSQTIIDLTGDTISAGDALVGVSLHLATGEAVTGTLSDFTGATSSAAGAHGLVPAPAAGDQGKVLKGDGTWGAVPTASSSTVGGIRLAAPFDVQSNGTLTIDPANTTRNGAMTNVDWIKLHNLPTASELAADYQTKLVSGTSIKTINSTSLLGSGDISITVPTKVSDLTNDSGFITDPGVTSVNGATGAVTIPATGDAMPVSTGSQTTVAAAIAARATLEQVYPVGAIYISTASTDPATLFGFGTWSRILGQFLLAADGRTYVTGTTGGEATHTLTESEMPTHTHDIEGGATNVIAWVGANNGNYGLASGKTVRGRSILDAGGGQPHNNMPPYYAVYMWERTA